MKKKLEAELISIAHRILKLKNRSELDQLQQETLKLYEKLSVLKFVEDNFSDVKPTIGYSSAEETLEEIYGIEEVPPVHANEMEAKEDKAREEKAAKKDAKPAKVKQDKENESGEGVTAGKEEAPVADEEKEYADETVEETTATEDEKEQDAPGPENEEADGNADKNIEDGAKEDRESKENEEADDEPAKDEEPEAKIAFEKTEGDNKAMEESAEAVYTKEDESSPEEEEKAADAEVITIEPDKDAKTEDSGAHFDFAFERKPAPEEPRQQKEITFEDYHDYKEPEFVKKGADTEQKGDEPKAEAAADDDWRNWEPNKSSEEPKEEAKKDEPKAEAKRSLNDSLGKTISLGLNDRIAFEKHLFAGSSEDLNRVLSQLNTHNTFDEAQDFINDLVKPDYNNWKGKEEYEARFMELVEKKFS